jgi:hypothetical protein
MSRKYVIIMLLVSLVTASLACSLVDDLVGGGAEVQGDGKTGDIETAPIEEIEDTDLPEMSSEDESEASTADNEVLGDTAQEANDQASEEETAPETPPELTEYETVFPLPDTVLNFMDMGNDSINFQTELSVEETIAFYRQAFEAENLSERTLNTAITVTTFSMVFDGHTSGTIVIQGVDLGDGTTNVNIRFEDV